MKNRQPRSTVPCRYASLCAAVVVACGAEPTDAAGDREEASATTEPALSAGGLSITGTSNLSPLPASDGYAHIFDATFTLANRTTRSVSLTKQLFFFAAPGGYAYASSLDFGVWWPNPVPAWSSATIGPYGWWWSAPVAHLVMRADGRTTSGAPVAGLAGIPVLAAGKTSPGPSPYTNDVDIGVQAPIEILNLAGSGPWLPITGTVVDTTQTAAEPPTLTIQARDAWGNPVATLAQAFGFNDSQPVLRTFQAWTALGATTSVASVRITASLPIQGGTASQTRNLPVVNARPVSIVSPVSGTWMWANGPGQTWWSVHTGVPEGRYGYDLGVHRLVNGVLQSFAGDPNVNSSFFCWDQPIRAALTGTVVLVQDSLPDNNGWLQDNNRGNNEIIIQHANDVFTRYAHMRQGTATVHVGQTVYAGSVIALVGNAGNSSEPHLHFHVFKIDATGRQVAVPITIPGLKSTSGASLTGIPKGGEMYQTP